MYLVLIVLPLLASIVSGFFGRKVGVSGAQLITCSSIFVTTILSLFAFLEVGLNNIPVSIELFRWIDSESLNVLWAFQFDSLTVSMLIPVLIVSSLVHIYSIGYMSHDPHNQRFFSYLSLFTFMMIILVTANNFLLMFVGWEGVGICSYLLVSFWFTRIAANQSSMSAFLTNRVGDCFLTIGMFAILWSFGKKKNLLNIYYKYILFVCKRFIKLLLSDKVFKYYSTKSNKEVNYLAEHDNKDQGLMKLAPYLAGLIEGDGHIAVHDNNSKSKIFRPKIIITFNSKDKPLAEKLSSILKLGKVIPKKGGCVIIQILAKKDALKIIQLINGYMRTPKIEALHRAIRWINEKDNSSIPLLDLDLSPIDSNSWLAGFTDADGNFSINLTNQKKYGKVGDIRIQTFFRLELKQNYSKYVSETQRSTSYFNILTKVAAFFTVNLYTRTRYLEDKIYHSFIVISHNYRSHEIVRKYFDRYSLYSSKYLAYIDWCYVQDLQNLNKRKGWSKEDINKITYIKSQFNNKRKFYNFSHLESLTI